ncbi:energy transducer TonB [Phyllobacterium sp. P30BS-XVII]|uniref:energy transducer TonB n=1 Tax=Phyllobacterium sp. P30BS-XVII TaxID=2587046 RepID=UPI000DD9FB1D|nr:energy transducer TonB [Phyllobacterium sp. P30BS-XVII]MBA8901775.1 protein TonB [Phyllobacterium sp. P30BS-XVII]
MPDRPVARVAGQFQTNWREIGLWSAAAIVAIGVHAGAGWYGYSYQSDTSGGEVAAAVMIDMEPLPAPVVPEAVAELPPVEPEKVTPEPVQQEAAAPEIQPEKPVEPEPQPTPEEQVVPEEVQPEETVELPKVEVPLPVVKPEPKKLEPKKDVPKKIVRKIAKARATDVKSDTVVEAKAAPVMARSASASEARAWDAKLNAHLARYKRTVRIGGSGGTRLKVRISIALDGSVQSATIASSSGNPDYDRAAITMVQRASPLPTPPEGMSRGDLVRVLPFTF